MSSMSEMRMMRKKRASKTEEAVMLPPLLVTMRMTRTGQALKMGPMMMVKRVARRSVV
jgi:hypothetical protein